MSDALSPSAVTQKPAQDYAAGRAALSEAARHVDIIHTSLAGMALIVLVLLFAVALPVFGQQPVVHISAFIIMVLAAMAGIGYLYYVNYRVHQHVSNQARLTEVLVNSLGQGFLSFNKEGVCGRVYSQACLELLEGDPSGQNIVDVLRIPDAQRGDFNDWVDVLFNPEHALGFDDIAQLLPKFFAHGGGRRIRLSYKPIEDKSGQMASIVVIATDETEEYQAQQLAKQQQSYADMICRIFKERNQFHATVTHTRKFVEAARKPDCLADASSLLRSLHTLKAAVKHFHLDALGDTIHKLESDLRGGDASTEEKFLARLRQGCDDIEQGLASALDQVRELIGQDYERKGNVHEVEETTIYAFAEDMHNNNANPALIHRYLYNIAAVPIQQCFDQFERELLDLAEVMGKQVKPVRYTGTNPRILTQPIHEFLFSLTHVCRNIVDHGIEAPVTRLARGKDPSGQVSVHTDVVADPISNRDWLHIVIADDGGGIDPARIREKLATTDPQGPWRQEDDHTIIQHIFNWGFSTRENVTDMSGRGVGLEAVDREVRELGGSIKVFSELYRGVRFEIKIPQIFDLKWKTLKKAANS